MCMYVFMYVCIYVCIFVYVYVCMYVCMYVLYVHTYVCIYYVYNTVNLLFNIVGYTVLKLCLSAGFLYGYLIYNVTKHCTHCV